MSKLYELRPHQVKSMTMLRESFAQGLTRPLLYVPTGGGKTVIAAHIIAGALDKGRHITFVAPRINLCDQTARSLMAQGLPKPSIMQGDHPWFDAGNRFQIATNQTLTRRRDSIKTDIYIIDEAHLNFQVITDIAEETNTPIIALTATPFTKGLGKTYNNLLKPTSIRELINNELLTDFECYSHDVKPDLKGIKMSGGDYNNKQLGDRCSDPKLVGDIVKTWLKLGENRQTICFAVNVAHANYIESEFTRCGVTCAVVVGATPVEERQRIFKEFESKNIKILISVFVLCEGYDGDVRCLIDAAPTKSEARHSQKIGRAIRIAKGKDHAIILDHAANMVNLGFPEDLEVDDLCNGEKNEAGKVEKKAVAKKEKLPKECSKCNHLKKAGEHECSKCGFTPKFIENVEVDETQELKAIKIQNKHSKDDKVRIYAELMGLKAEDALKGRAKADGYYSHLYKDITSVWPKGMTDKAITPSEQLRGFVKHKKIAFAKSRNK